MGWGLPAGHPPRCPWVPARRRCRWHPAGGRREPQGAAPQGDTPQKKPGRTDTDGQTDAAPYRWSWGAGGTPGTDEPPHALGPRTEVLAGGGLSPNLPSKKLQGGGFPWAEAPQNVPVLVLRAPPQLLGLGDNRGRPPPHGYSRVPPVVPAVPASRRSPGRDREELSASPPRHQGLILPRTPPLRLLTLAPFSPGVPAGPGFPTSP